MSYFSTELQRLLDTMPGSRAGFAVRVGIAASTFHNYFHGTTPPVVADLEKICSFLQPPERVDLVIAHLRDQTPPSAEEYVRIVSLLKEPRVKEETEQEYTKIKLPQEDMENFEFLMRKAVNSPSIRESIAVTRKLIEGV